MSLAVALVSTGVWGVLHILDPSTLPIRSVRFEGTFRYIDSQQLQRAVTEQVSGGFFSVDIDSIRQAVEQRPWVDWAAVRRVWPDTLRIQVREHEPLARWGVHGLLNTQGEWFPASQEEFGDQLPHLAGPDGFERLLANRYREINRMLKPIGREVVRVRVNERRAWLLELDNGVAVRLGRRDVANRLRRFIAVYPTVLDPRIERIEAVDLRYTNGFAVRWKPDASQPDDKTTTTSAGGHARDA